MHVWVGVPEREYLVAEEPENYFCVSVSLSFSSDGLEVGFDHSFGHFQIRCYLLDVEAVYRQVGNFPLLECKPNLPLDCS